MKKLISLLVVLAMLMAMVPAVYAEETSTETTTYQEVTIPEAIELAQEGSNTMYLVRGTVTEVENTTYGNMYIADEEGNSLYIYGLYSIDGATRFDAMETQPAVGDTVALLGTLSTYNGTAQMKNAKLHELNEVVYEIPEVPEYEVVTAPEAGVAYKFGMIQEQVSTTDVYYMTGAMSSYYMATTTAVTAAADVYLEETDGGYYLYAMVDGAKKYVNMVVSGTYVNGAFEDAASTVYTFDAESNTLVATVNDTLYRFGTRSDKTYTTVGPVKTTAANYYCQLYAEVVEEETVEIPEGGIELTLGTTRLNAGYLNEYYDYTPEIKEYYYVAEQTGTLYITFLSFGYGDYNAGEYLLGSTSWVQLSLNGELVTSFNNELEVNAGDLVNITLNSIDGDAYFAHVNLNYEGTYVPPVGTVMNPIALTPDECPTTTMEIPAGEEVYYALDYAFEGYTLYVYGENAYIVTRVYDYEAGDLVDKYIYAVDGVVTFPVNYYEIRIGNLGDTAVSFEMDADIPLGSEYNPDDLTVGEHVVEMVEGNEGYYFDTTATEAGTMTITITGDSYWQFLVENTKDPSTWRDDYYHYAEELDETCTNTVTFDVAIGDYISLVVRLIDPEADYSDIAGTLIVTVEFTPAEDSGDEGEEEENLTLVLGNNYLEAGEGWGTPAVTKEYTYVAEQTGTLYITFRSFGCNGNIWSESALTNEYYAEDFSLLINGEKVTVYKNTVEVTEGDTVVITLASLDSYPYQANVVLSYDGYYEEPLGSEFNPIELTPEDLPTYTVEIAAGETAHYKFSYDFYDYTLYVYGEDAYIVVNRYNYDTDQNEPYYIYAVDGVVEYDFSDGLKVQIGNAGDETATFLIEGEIPVGIYNNPDTLIIGEQTAVVPGNYNGYWYTWTAPEAGTLTITVTGDNWGFDLSNETTYDYLYHYGFEGDANTASMTVAAGDVIMLNLLTIGADGWGDYPGGELTVVAEFTTGDDSGEDTEPEDNTLELGYNMPDVAEGETLEYTWTATEDTLFVINMISANWTYRIDINDAQGTVRSSADETVVHMTVVEVVAGDVITLTIGTADGAADSLEFTTATCTGTAASPIEIAFNWNEAWTAAAINVDMPAGEYVFQMMSGAGMTLTVGGVVTEMTGDGWFDPIQFIANVAEAGVVPMTLTYPVGTYYNPEQLELGDNAADVDESGMGYWYTYTAEEDTLFVLTMLGDNWFYSAMIQRADGTFGYPDGHYSSEEAVVPMQILELKTGDILLLNFGTDDYSAATVEFTTAICQGTAASPIEIAFAWNEAWTAAAINVDMPAGEYVFQMMSGAGMTLTVGGVVTEMTGDGWFDPIQFIANVAEAGVVPMTLTYPVGTYYNPEQLELGNNAADVDESGMGYWYTYTAESDTLFALTMYGDNWFYSAMIQRADGTFGYPDGHYSSEETVVPMQVLELKAGDILLLNFGTDDYSAATVEFYTMTYAGTAEDPVMVEFAWNEEWTAASINADLPAGEYVYGSRGIAGTNLTVNGVETEIIPGMSMRNPDTFVINNTEEANAVFALELSYPVGSWMNPDEAEEGENVAEIEAGNVEGYFFTWTAPADGTLTVTIGADGGWYYVVNNETSGVYGDAHWSDDNPVVNPEVIEVKAGDVIQIIVNTYDPENGMGAAGEITVDLLFTPAAEGLPGDVNGDGKVDMKDLTRLRKYLAGEDVEINMDNADVNGDGKVDMKDLTRLRKYLAGDDVVLG